MEGHDDDVLQLFDLSYFESKLHLCNQKYYSLAQLKVDFNILINISVTIQNSLNIPVFFVI